ncbi:MAG: HD domain-containing protein [Gemmataceae bacterium]|nr:HD domain-containing protein [Gemmataceae bacterium]
MSRRYVDQLRDGDNLDDVYLVTDKQVRANRNGNPFLLLELRDRTGGIQARMWNAGEPQARGFAPGDFLHATGKVQLHQGALQVILNTIDRVEAQKVELTDFLPHTEQSVPKLMDRLRGHLGRLGNPHLKALAECFLSDDAFSRAFVTCPAGVKLHHATVGGLLEHTVSMMDAADRLHPLYPWVDRDLLLMGVFLHDAGKVRELTYTRAFGYSDEGQLVGHLAIGLELLTEMAAKVPDLTGEPVPRELLLRLRHMILSHHGTLEWGSPRLPMTPEAVLLHLIDSVDTRMNQVYRELKEDRNNPSAWTPYNPNLGRRFYKGGANGDLYGEGGGGYD